MIFCDTVECKFCFNELKTESSSNTSCAGKHFILEHTVAAS